MPDTLDGRFAVLATVDGDGHRPAGAATARRASALSVALTERFIEVMESEHREIGIGDPALGKTVRKLVACSRGGPNCGARPSRTEATGRSDARKPLRDEPSAAALEHSAAALAAFGERLDGDAAGPTLNRGSSQ